MGRSIEMGKYQVNYFIVIEANVTEMLPVSQALYQAFSISDLSSNNSSREVMLILIIQIGTLKRREV